MKQVSIGPTESRPGLHPGRCAYQVNNGNLTTLGGLARSVRAALD